MVGDTPFDAADRIADYNQEFWRAGGFELLITAKQQDALGPSIDLTNERLGPPIAKPSKLICVGINYRDHATEAGVAIPTEPIIFLKAPNTVVGPNDDVVIPPGAEKVDWEVELAVVIGKECKYLPDPDSAMPNVGGFVISNDISERSYQLERGGQWVKGKSCETFNPIGPFLASPDGIDHKDLNLELSINGEAMQNSNTSEMIFDVPYLIWYLSQFMVLEPGDVVNTGTPSGVGLGLQPARYLSSGDVMRLSIEGLGSQQQRCVDYGAENRRVFMVAD